MLSLAHLKKLFAYLAEITLIFLGFLPFAQAQNIRLQFDPISLDQISAAQIRTLLQDHYGFVWIGTDDGLVCCDGYEFKQFKNEPFDSSSITANLVNALYEDTEGTLWVGTSEGGLNRLNRQSGRFTNFSPQKGNPYSLNGLSISALATDFAGGLWVGLSGGGLQRYDPEGEKFTTFMPPHPDFLKRYPKYQSHVRVRLDAGLILNYMQKWDKKRTDCYEIRWKSYIFKNQAGNSDGGLEWFWICLFKSFY